MQVESRVWISICDTTVFSHILFCVTLFSIHLHYIDFPIKNPQSNYYLTIIIIGFLNIHCYWISISNHYFPFLFEFNAPFTDFIICMCKSVSIKIP